MASGCGSTHLVEDPEVLISENCKLYLGPTPPQGAESLSATAAP